MPSKNVMAEFTFDSGKHTYEVVECSYGFTQSYDASNKPSGRPSINIISLVLKAADNPEIAEWMVSSTAEKDGEIKIKITESKFRKIKFKRGFCVQYNERFDNYSGESILISIGILVKDINIDDHAQLTAE